MTQAKNSSIAVVGCGRVGRNWALLFLRAGWRVRVFDPNPEVEPVVRRALAQARREIPDFATVDDADLSFHTTLSDTVKGAVWIQESAPDRLDLKRAIYQKLQAHAAGGALIASSSKTLTTSDVQACVIRAKYVLVVRPLSVDFSSDRVAVLEGISSAPELVKHACDFLRELGLAPEVQLG